VHEQDAEIPIGGDRIGGDRAVHVGVAARLEHDRPAQTVEVLAGVAALLEHGHARDRIDAAGHNAERLAGRVRVERHQAPPAGRRLPVTHQAIAASSFGRTSVATRSIVSWSNGAMK
jgi:hypothetical protein